MIIFLEEHKALLRKLIDAKVNFILIGGYAVNFHGYNRPTGDMDLWLKPENENKKKFIKMMLGEGYSEESLKAISKLDFKQASCFHIGKPPLRIDFLTRISRVEFEEAWKEKQELPMGKYAIPVIHLHHLILTKMGTGRIRDNADIDELQKVNKLKK